MGRGDSAEAWDERYAGSDRIWSGHPNPALVAEVTGLPPGTALDIGCGEGADAIWLASHGWEVTALDISAIALERAARHAEDAATKIRWIRGAFTDTTLDSAGFDLVSAQYPALRRTPGHDAERKLLAAVAPGGVLLVVHHADVDVEAARAHGFNPDDYLQPADIAALLDEKWQIQVDERRPRHPPAGPNGQHTHDLVLRARRVK